MGEEWIFYAPPVHITYLTVFSWFLISFVMGGSGSSRANKLLCTSPPPSSVWDLKPPLWALVHKTTYEPIIYTALCIMFLMRAYPLLGQVWGGWALELSSFLCPKWHSHWFNAISQSPKNSQMPGPNPLPLALYWICTHPKHYAWGCINHRCINS